MKLLTLLLACLMLSGCRHTELLRTIIIVDPNGVTTIDQVHIGATSLCTDTELDGLVIESGKGDIVLNRAVNKEDSIKASALVGGVPVTVETK